MKKILSLLGLTVSLSALAQDAGLELDPVTITASLQAKKISETGRNITIFKGENFANLPVHSIDDLLRFLPGVEVQMRGPMGSQSDIVLRGGTFQQVLILLDGVRINDPNTGHFNSYIPISPAEIDRIEVLKGASSAIYGAEAVGGVIQVITKTYAAKQDQQKLQLSGQFTAGEYGLMNANIGGFYQQKNTAVSGGLISNNADGQQQRGTKGFFHNNTGSVSVSKFLNQQWQLSLRAAYDKRDFAAQNFYTTFASDTASEQVSTMWTQARVSYSGKKHRFNIDAGYKDVKDHYLYNKQSVANENTSRLFQGTVTDEWKLAPKTTLISGVQVIEKSIRSNDRGNHDLLQGGVFLLANHELVKNFIINPALRLDWNDISGAELIPQINLSYSVNKLQVRGSAGKTIRDADFTERFNNYSKPTVTGGSVGNPGLKAERSFSYEAGVDYFATKGFKISASVFQRLQTNLIDWVSTPYADMPRKDNLVAGRTYALAQNIAKVNTSGVELDVQYQQNFTDYTKLIAGAGLVWMDSETKNGLTSFYISSHAKFMSNLFTIFSYHNLSVSVTANYKRRKPQQAAAINATIEREYFIMNARAAYSFWQKRISVFTQIDNIGDKKYSDLLGSLMPGRWFAAGVNVSFHRN